MASTSQPSSSWVSWAALCSLAAGTATALSAPPPQPPILLRELVSSCIDACERGCSKIRAVEGRKGPLDVRRKVLADARSALTEADLEAQAAIVGALRRQWPGLRIVGEEDDDAATDAAASAAIGCAASEPVAPLRLDLLGHDAQSEAVPVAEVTVFVDPLDGTREFVEGRLDAVQSLIGIAVRGRPRCGVAGLPFATATAATGGEPPVAYALDNGLEWHRRAKISPDPLVEDHQGGLVVVTGDSRDPAMLAALAVAEDWCQMAPVTLGATGNKLLAVADGRADLAILHRGSSAWDTCAWEAALDQQGGLVTDFFGAPLNAYYRTYRSENASGGAPTVANGLGVLASPRRGRKVHGEVCRAMRANQAALNELLAKDYGVRATEEGHAADVARDLDGRPLHVARVGLAVNPAGRLLAYAAPEGAAVRGALSQGCRLRLHWADNDDVGPRSAFYKRVVMADLPAARQKAKTQPQKLKRDVESFRVEAAFLNSEACRRFRRTEGEEKYKNGSDVVRAVLPEAYAADLRPVAGPSMIESRFSLVLSDFGEETWTQRPLLDSFDETKAALHALARFHAYFWQGSKIYDDAAVARELRAAVWPAGAHWQPAFQSDDQLTTRVRDEWPRLAAAFADAFAAAGFDAQKVATLGARLQDIAPSVGVKAHPFSQQNATTSEAASPYCTLIHGDLKAANLFVRYDKSDRGQTTTTTMTTPPDEIGFIDFQFAGFGLAATDVAHFFCCAVGAGPLQHHDALLDEYFRALREALDDSASPSSSDPKDGRRIDRAVFQDQYDTAVLDMCRLIVAYQWPRIDASPASLKKGEHIAARNSYNKRLDNALWIVGTCLALLDKRDAKAPL